MASNTPMQLNSKIQAGLVEFKRSCHNLVRQHWNIRDQMRMIDLAVMRENDFTTEHRRAQVANRYGDSTKLQNLVVPVIMPQVETAVTYQESVFLTGNPIFGVVASPKYEDAALQMETILSNQATRGGWAKEISLFFRDGFKYNISALEVEWVQQVTAAIETDINYDTKLGRPKQVIWEGNRIKRLDPYNLLFDTRVAPTAMHTDGEFAGYITLMGRTALKAFINKLADKMVDNVNAAFESGTEAYNNYYIPQLNYNSLVNRNARASTDWLAWATASDNTPKIAYKNLYEVTKLYGRIIPSDFGMKVPSPNTPQVWKLIFVNEVLIYAERQTNAHDLIPILFGQPLEDGLEYQTKSFATNVQPIQEVTSALLTSVIEARRRAISDRTLYDPSRIREADINSSNPVAKIPVRPSAYGKPLQEAVYAFPFRDDQSVSILQEIPQFSRFADTISGQNQAQQGQFVKGNKTLHEYANVMQNANGRSQSIAMMLEAQVFTPLKEILKINILQYQGGTELYNPSAKQQVAIDPIVLRTAIFEFKVSDGLTPSDKLINGDTFTTALQVMGSSPQIASSYNIAPLFSYLMKTQGADIMEFEKPPEQVQYEQAIGQWQQAVTQIAKDNPDIKPEQYPPQPTPQQFGIGQDGKPTTAPTSKPTLIEQVMAISGTTSPATTGVQQ